MMFDLNQIEAMPMNELRARYGALEVELFNLKVALSEVSLEMERRLKCAVEHPQGVELTRANGDSTLYIVGASSPEHLNRFLGRDHPLAVRFSEMCAEYVQRIQDEWEVEQVARKTRSDKGTHRETERDLDHSSCCGAEGRRMNAETLDCAACRGVVE